MIDIVICTTTSNVFSTKVYRTDLLLNQIFLAQNSYTDREHLRGNLYCYVFCLVAICVFLCDWLFLAHVCFLISLYCVGNVLSVF